MVYDKVADANNVDPDQTAAPEEAVWSGSTLFAILLCILQLHKQNFRSKEYGMKCSKCYIYMYYMLCSLLVHLTNKTTFRQS